MLTVMLTMTVPAIAGDGAVILHPGYLSGNITVTDANITYVIVRAVNTNGVFSASVTVSVPEANSIAYNLTVEGDRDYYVIADARVVATDITNVVLPMVGPVYVPIGATVTRDLSVAPAFISGTISTTTDGNNTIESFNIYARIQVPEFGTYQWFYNRTYAYGLSEPGQPGRDYTLLVAPGLSYYFYANITINGVQYNLPIGTVTAPLDHDFTIDVTAATISGTALLQGTETDVYLARVYGYSYSPPPARYANTQIADIPSGAYTLDVTAGDWYVYPQFYFHLTGDLSGLNGYLRPPWTQVPDVNDGDHVTDVNFIIDPGFITGTVSLTGANTDIGQYSYIQAYSWPTTNGYMQTQIDPCSGDYMFVASAGGWQYYYLHLRFDYPDDPDTSLWSYLYRRGTFLDPCTVTSGETVSDVNVTFGTATVRLIYYVEGGGDLSSPYLIAKRTGTPTSTAYAWGSPSVTSEGQAITTLLPGTYTIEAFANVEGSQTEFGTFTIDVNEGDVVVIGGVGRPTIIVTNPTDGEVIPADSVTVVGTATDDEGIASITINGEDVPFTSTGNPGDPCEVGFSYDVNLLIIGENTITVVATDVDGTDPVTLTLTVTRVDTEEEVIECPVDIKPGSCPNPLNVKSKGVLPVAILGTGDFDVTTIDLDTVRLLDVAPVRSDYEDVGTPFFPLLGKEDALDCTELEGDGLLDLSLKFDMQEIVPAIGEDVVDGEVIVLTLTGNLLDGTPIEGEDVVIILKKGK